MIRRVQKNNLLREEIEGERERRGNREIRRKESVHTKHTSEAKRRNGGIK